MKRKLIYSFFLAITASFLSGCIQVGQTKYRFTDDLVYSSNTKVKGVDNEMYLVTNRLSEKQDIVFHRIDRSLASTSISYGPKTKDLEMDYDYDKINSIKQIPSPKAKVYIVSGLKASQCSSRSPYLTNIFYIRDSKLYEGKASCWKHVPFAVSSDKGDRFVMFEEFASQESRAIEVDHRFKSRETIFKRVRERFYSELADYKYKKREDALKMVLNTNVKGYQSEEVKKLNESKGVNYKVDENYKVASEKPIKIDLKEDM